MRCCFLGFFLVASSQALAADAFFCSDALVAGGNAGLEGGFDAGEEAAIKIEPPLNAYPLSITQVLLLYGFANDNNAAAETIVIYDDTGVDNTLAEGYPGNELFSVSAPLIDSTESLNPVAVDPPLDLTGGAFWVAVRMARPGDPGGAPGPLTDGTQNPSHSAIKSGGVWADAASLGVDGNWVIRVEANAATAQSDAACRLSETGGEGEGDTGGEGEGDTGGGEGEGEGDAGALTVTSVNPAQADAGAETRVTLTGSGFADGVTVRVGSVQCTDVQVQNAGALLATVPGTLKPDVYDVIVQEGAAQFSFASGFTVNAGGCGCSSSTSSASLTALAALSLWLLPRLRRLRRRR